MAQETRAKQPDEMYCPSCGAVIKREAEICVHCGVRVRRPSGQVGGVGAGSRVAELEKLHALREKGALSEQEFEEAKARVLAAAPRLDREELRRRGMCFREYPVWVMTFLSVITFGIYTQF